ncbi:flagellar basal body-associated FliL family protein [Clostridium sp. D2Q-14]|uniref:flagellar basal body-associated FliL family protein n=1 Tax=Anaeromonas gelatinilytica TaxID=2683194 RepID=UPI00193B2A43|nr:flagellar basal body-associated FliL family protein [Anaeromonas gelatinilytica]MBS4536043.1 flagellar basal body-associated FliL family protein [Anaeromonas gelatinilytica]
MSSKKILLIAVIVLILLVIISGIIFSIYLLKDDSKEKSTDYYYDVGEIYSNLDESNRILKVNLTITAQDENLVEIFNEKSFLIKDELYKILRSKTIEDIEGEKGQLKLKEEIISNLNKIFTTDKINNIYFDELIVQ